MGKSGWRTICYHKLKIKWCSYCTNIKLKFNIYKQKLKRWWLLKRNWHLRGEVKYEWTFAAVLSVRFKSSLTLTVVAALSVDTRGWEAVTWCRLTLVYICHTHTHTNDSSTSQTPLTTQQHTQTNTSIYIPTIQPPLWFQFLHTTLPVASEWQS